jgi:hypothetical protein
MKKKAAIKPSELSLREAMARRKVLRFHLCAGIDALLVASTGDATYDELFARLVKLVATSRKLAKL